MCFCCAVILLKNPENRCQFILGAQIVSTSQCLERIAQRESDGFQNRWYGFESFCAWLKCCVHSLLGILSRMHSRQNAWMIDCRGLSFFKCARIGSILFWRMNSGAADAYSRQQHSVLAAAFILGSSILSRMSKRARAFIPEPARFILREWTHSRRACI